ncbi:hypothetical protein [Pyrobaculum ferrireducens]|uniref:Uncharacterized protein n=1 Tax=Pyrobaculum ferrireducens TaxID=1104324 RepID=G7VGJ0_9CREN|nr:hypothetical protein [Pyrobaculum ferrireducens]AET33090.1 hypothetical protein P186_1676 [Pyrobaculum ferrireducens]
MRLSLLSFKKFFTPKTLAVLLLAVALAAGVGMWLYVRYDPGSSSICATCHNMAPFVADISKTPHGAVACAWCHSIDFPRWLYVQVVENPTPQQIAQRYSATMLSQCVSCHSQQLNPPNIHKTHTALVQKLADCTICHNPHNPQALSANCQICHDINKILASHMEFHAYAWAQVDTGRYDVCLECHSPWGKWYVPIGPDCQLGIGRGVTCIGCHGPRAEPFQPIQFLDCGRCHAR